MNRQFNCLGAIAVLAVSLAIASASNSAERPVLLAVGGCAEGFYRSPEGDCRQFDSREFYSAQSTYEDHGEIEIYGQQPECIVRDTPEGPRRFCATD